MATISSTRQVPNPGYNPWTSTAELDTSTGVITISVNGGSGKLLYQGDPATVINQITQNTQYNNDKAFFDNLISIINEQSESLKAQYNELVPSAVDPDKVVDGPASTNTEQQNKAYIANGGANDEKGNQNTATSSPTTYYESDGTPSSTIAVPPNAGTTTSGKSDTPAAASSKDKPGKRLKNPLGDFASYTYQITLYMITPDAYDAFVKSGRRSINAINNITPNAPAAPQQASQQNGAFIVAQSGGINNSTSKRAPGMKLDYYIDDLKFTTVVGTKESGTSTNTLNMTFNIIEPYGFSFITQLRNATNTLQKVSKSKNFSKVQDPTRQFFVIGVRFQGYDINGAPMTGKETFAGDTFDPKGNSDGVFERFWDINITGIKFKIDGRATTYRVEAQALSPGVSFGVKRGIIDRGAKIVAGTVDEALTGNDSKKGVIGLLTKLNNDQLELVKNKSITPGMETTYSVEWLGNAKTLIADQTIVSKADLDKSKFPMAQTAKTSDSNDALSEKAVPNSNRRQITFRNGTPILQAIGLIIAQSSFLEKALKSVYTTALEPESDSNSEDQIVNSQTKTIRWYNLSSEVKCKGWDPRTNDFAYDIKFLIQPYETPIVLSPFAKKTAQYYGPYKRYEYWYTGKNSEVISYEHSTDNTFSNVVLNGNSPGSNDTGAAQIPVVPGKQSGQPRQGKTVPGMEAQNSYLTSLFDPGSWVTAKVNIMGDPDFLMTESSASSTSENYVYNQFYGTDGYTINPNGGQVFIEIDFKEAIDYDNGTGVMSLNDSILMQQYPPGIAKKVKGVSYMLKSVTSTFSKGKFIQELDCNINTFAGASDDEVSAVSGARPAKATTTTKAPNKTGTGTSNNTNMVQDDVTGLEEAYNQQAAMNEGAAADAFYDMGPATQITAPTEDGTQVNNDDAVNNNYTQPVEESGREA